MFAKFPGGVAIRTKADLFYYKLNERQVDGQCNYDINRDHGNRVVEFQNGF